MNQRKATYCILGQNICCLNSMNSYTVVFYCLLYIKHAQLKAITTRAAL